MLDHKSNHGILALKIDISKDFDTLGWSFLMKVLKKFGGFNLYIILHSHAQRHNSRELCGFTLHQTLSCSKMLNPLSQITT